MNGPALPIPDVLHQALSKHQRDGALLQFSSSDDDDDSPNRVFGGPWHRGEQLTLSVVPDGTPVLNQQSTLFSSFAWMLDENELKNTINRALQTWARTTNLNSSLVEDDGSRLGIAGFEQRDSRFGDIRVAAIEMAPDIFAVAIPIDDLSSGTWAGDVIFNSAAKFENVNQFYHVALHELGHAIGMEHSNDPNSPMFFGSNNIRITPGDVANLRELYGIRSLDQYETFQQRNDSMDNATNLEFAEHDIKGETPLVAFGDLWFEDQDYFRVNLPSDYSGRLTFRVESTGLSSLAPFMTILDEDGNVVRKSGSFSQQGDALLTSIPRSNQGGKYFVRVEGAGDNVFNMGSYVVSATLNDVNTMGWQRVREFVDSGLYNLEDQDEFQEALRNEVHLLNEDFNSDDEPEEASDLEPIEGFEDRGRYEIQGSISNLGDVDYYRLQLPETSNTGVVHLNVRIDSLAAGGLIPDVHVLDSLGDQLNARVLVNSNGQLSVQVPNLAADSTVTVGVRGKEFSPDFSTGNYRMTIDFSDQAASFQRFAVGELTQSGEVQEHTLFVARSQLLHLNLLSQRNSLEPDAVVWMTIYDEEENVRFRSATRPGETRSASTAYFEPGSYSVKLELVLPDGGLAERPVTYRVRGRDVSDPEGPPVLDPTDSPFDRCSPTSPNFCYPGGNSSPQSYVFIGDEYVFVQDPNTPWVDINRWYWYNNWLTETVPPNL